MDVQSCTVRRMTLSTSRSSSDQFRRASCLVSFSERGWFLMRKNRSKLRSHISSSNKSRVLPAATASSIHWRNWPRRKSEGSSRSGGPSSPRMSDIGGDYTRALLPLPDADGRAPGLLIAGPQAMDNQSLARVLQDIADVLE